MNIVEKEQRIVNSFSDLYKKVREKENRLYTDEQLRKLPMIAASHPHYEEWKIRKESTDRLINYLKKKGSRISILEIGCGNGWLTNRLSEITEGSVTGVDVNETELQQAKRVFANKYNVYFEKGDIRSGILRGEQYDIIILAASIQYFNSFGEIIRACLKHLPANGEIHIIDSHFYRPDEVGIAKSESDKYYKALGYPEMSENYFHHLIDEYQQFDYDVLYKPRSLWNRMLKKGSPFPWIRIKHDMDA